MSENIFVKFQVVGSPVSWLGFSARSAFRVNTIPYSTARFNRYIHLEHRKKTTVKIEKL